MSVFVCVSPYLKYFLLTFTDMQANNLFKFEVFSLNVRGIRDQTKRRSIFTFLKDQNTTIYFLQETFSEPSDENIWNKEWGGELLFSHGTKHSKGVCILINPTAQLQVDYLYSNNSGRIVLITTSLNGKKNHTLQYLRT